MKYLIIIVALVLFPCLLFSSPPQEVNQYVFGKKLYEDKMYELAAEQLHNFAIENPDNPRAAEALYLAGMSYFNIKNYDQAQKEFLFLILRFPSSNDLPQAQFKIAECFQFMGKSSDAASAYRQVQIYYPKSPLAEQALFMSIKTFFDANQYDDAIEVASDFLEIYPTGKYYHQARLILAESFVKKNDYDRAHLELKKILSSTEAGPINARAILLNANLYYQAGLFQTAEDEYKNLIKKYTISRFSQDQEIQGVLDEAHFNLSTIFKINGMHEISNEYLFKVHNYEKDARTLNAIADNYISLNEIDKALAILQKSLSIQDSSCLPINFQKLADCYFSLKDFSKAIEMYQKALNCSTKDKSHEFQLYLKISEAYLNLNQPETAIYYLKKCREIKPESNIIEVIDYQIGVIYEKQIRDFERAIRWYYDFLERYPQSKYVDDAEIGLARCYEKSGNRTMAIKAYQKFIDKYTESKHYSEAKARINYILNYFQIDAPKTKALGEIVKQMIEQNAGHEKNKYLLYQLALYYFNELKEYQTAIEIFHKLETNDEVEKDQTLYYTSRAFQLLGEKEFIDEGKKSSYLDSAAIGYQSILIHYPQSSWADSALLHQIELEKIFLSGSPDSLIKIRDVLTNYANKFLESKVLDQIYLQLSSAILSNRIKDAKDSLLVYEMLQQMMTKFPESKFIADAAYLNAHLFFQTKNYDRAEQELASFISNYPHHHKIWEANFILSKLLAVKENYSRAIQILENIIANSYYSEIADSAKLNIGRYLLFQNKYDEALTIFLDLYQGTSSNQLIMVGEKNNDQSLQQDIIFSLAYASKMLRYEDKAINYFQDYLRSYPNGKYRDQVLLFLSELFNIRFDKDKQSKAIDYLRQIENNPISHDSYIASIIKLGNIFFDQENYEDAYHYYSKAQSLPLNEDQKLTISFQEINCLYKMGKLNEADDKFREFKKKYKEERIRQANLLLEKGNFLLNNKIFDQAEKLFKEVRSEFKNSAEGIKAEYYLGKLYFILNRNEEALELLTTLIIKNPDDRILAEVYITLGNFYYLTAKQIENALFAFKKATEQKWISDENLKIAMHNLIKCYADLQQWDRAIALSRELISKFPSSEDIFERKIQIAYYYYRLKEYDFAIQLFKQILPEADIDNEPRIQFWIGECYFNKGEFQKAISEYLKILYISKPAKLLNQYKVTALYQAAISSIKLQKFDNAKQMLQRIINEQGAESVFGKSAREKLDEITNMLNENKDIKI